MRSDAWVGFDTTFDGAEFGFKYVQKVEEMVGGCGDPGSRDEGAGAEGDGVVVQVVYDVIDELWRDERKSERVMFALGFPALKVSI